MLVQEVFTEVPAPEVINRAADFFLTRFSPYAGFVQERSDTHVRIHCDSGEVVIAAIPGDERTLVRASTSRLHHELSQFLGTLTKRDTVRANMVGPGVSGAG